MQELYYDAPIYFVTMNSASRKAILDNPTVHDSFIQYARANLKEDRTIGRYVIMPDHVHFFVRIPYDNSLSTFVRLLKQHITKAMRDNGAVHNNHFIWQPGFFDHVIRKTESYEGKWFYVINNPVRKGLVSSFNEWPYQGEIGDLRY